MCSPESPCVMVCVLDENDECIGCYRSMKEITEWSMLSDSEKIEVNQNCERRKKDALA